MNPWPALESRVGSCLVLGLVFGLPFALAGCNFPDFMVEQAQDPAALVLGIASGYPGTGNDLDLTDDDALAVDLRLDEEGWDSRVLLDANCTPANFNAQVQTLAGQSQSGRLVLIYYSGHGSLLEDSDGNPSGVMVWTDGTDFITVSPADLALMLQPLLSKDCRIVLVLDCCYSGGFAADGAYVDSLPWNWSDDPEYLSQADYSGAWRSFLEWFADPAAQSDNPLTQALDPTRVWVMSAAGLEEESFEMEGGVLDYLPEGHGVFTAFLLGALTRDTSGGFSADRNADGHLTLREVYRQCYDSLDNWWNQTFALASAWYGYDYLYLPHISGNYTDIILFTR